MSIKKIMQELTPEEIADAYILPAKLSAKEKKEIETALTEHRRNRRAAMTDTEKLQMNLLQLKFQLEDYIKGDRYNPEYTFGHFLERYLLLINRKKKEFAKEIQVHETLLSHLISNRREPNESIMIRLELHSGNAIPAIDWFKLVEKEKEYVLKTDNSLREKEQEYVTHRLSVSV